MEKLLIGSLELTTTKSGKQVIELYSTNTALQFPELRLFDLSALVAVGIDANALTPGERVHRRFWAYFTISEKTNARGNPYRDVAHLEAIDQPATATSTDTTELLDALREMNRLLAAIAHKLDVDTTEPDPAMPEDPVQAANGEKPADVDALRDWYQNHRS